MHPMVGSNLGIRGYPNFHCRRSTSLYSYDDKKRTNLIHTSNAQTLRELVTSIPFSCGDRSVLSKLYFIFGNAIDTKDSLSLSPCP